VHGKVAPDGRAPKRIAAIKVAIEPPVFLTGA
jgi:hypothetical protein